MLSHWHTAWSQPLSHALPRLRSAHHIVLAKPRCRPIKANGSITQPNPDDEGDEREHLSCVATGLDAVTCFVDDGPEEATQQLGTQQSPPPEPNWTLASVALLVSPFAFWGTSMVVMKGLALSPLMMGTVRLLPAGALLVAWAVMRGRPHPSGWKAWAWVLAFGLVDGAAFQGFLAEGLQRTSAGLGSVIIDSQPLTVAVLAAILFGETLSSQAVQGLVLGVLGLLLLELPEQSLADADWASSGELWMLAAAQAMAVGTVMVRWVGVDPVMATGWHMVLGGVVLLAAALVEDPHALEEAAAVLSEPVALAQASYISVLGGAAGYGIFFWQASTKQNLTALSSLTFLTPVFAAVTGYFALNEVLTPPQLLGAAVTLSSVSLINSRHPSGNKPAGSASGEKQ
ncbi:EamA-like transporter family-domain-containing protein [Haematococcus lacustris]